MDQVVASLLNEIITLIARQELSTWSETPLKWKQLLHIRLTVIWAGEEQNNDPCSWEKGLGCVFQQKSENFTLD